MRDRPAPHSFDRLIRAGIAPRRAHRILREFAEHHADVVAECLTSGDSASEAEAAANARLGSEQQLVVNLLARPELRSWARRRPSLAFALAPVLSFALAFVASLLALIALVEWRKVHGDALNAASPVIQVISAYASFYLLWMLPCGVAALLAVMAARRREMSIWPCVGIAAVCFIGALTNFSVWVPPMADAPSMGAGIGIGTDKMGAILIRAGSTTALVLLPYLRARWLQRHELGALSQRSL
jgi:hypothetical protein